MVPEKQKNVKMKQMVVLKAFFGTTICQFVKKHACGGFFDEFCTVCLGAYGSPGGKRR